MTNKQISKQCIGCQSAYVSYACMKRKFCSKICWSNNATLTKPQSVFKKGMVSIRYRGGKAKCLDCDKRLSTYTGKRCRSCDLSFRWKAGTYTMPSGVDHYRWKGGVTPENKALRRRFQVEIAPLVLSRDKFTCTACEARNVELHVDHIKSWALSPELRFDMSNCRTLCRDCHYEITFGRPIPTKVTSWGRNLRNINRRATL